MKRKNFPRRKEQRRNEAQERQERRNGRSEKQQLELLDKKFGKDKGATKERLRLLTKKNEPKEKPAEECSS